MAAAPELYVKKPGKDFTRKKKLPFETVMQLLISMGGNSLYKELLESQGYNVNTATTFAFVQQRNKILPSAVEDLLTARICISQRTLRTRTPTFKVNRTRKALTCYI